MNRILFFIIGVLACQLLWAKNRPEGRFLSDSVMIGTPVEYSLSMKYPLDWQVIFPDSNFDYQPFEVIDIQYFETRSDSVFSFDSAVYTFLSFSIDPVQELSVPVTIINGKDSISIPTEPKSLFFRDLILVVSDTLSIRSNTAPALMKLYFNYPRLFWGIGIALVLLLLTVVFFGKRVANMWRAYILRRKNRKFLDLVLVYQNINGSPDKKEVEGFEKLWKAYMQSLSSLPYTAMTTREISKLGDNEEIVNWLKAMDNFIYGDRGFDRWTDLVIDMKNFAEDSFYQKLEQLKKGKA